MLFESHSPAAPLADFIEDFWFYDGYISPRTKERILPSGTFELVFNLREDELRIYNPMQPGQPKRFSGALVSGPYGRCFASDAIEETSILGVHFKPGGAFPFLGLPAGELADTHVDLAELWGKRALELREQLSHAATPADRFRLVEQSFSEHLFQPLQRHRAVGAALRIFAGAANRPARISSVAATIGIGERRLLDVFRAEVGITPKLFDRVCRFQRTLAVVRETAEPDWRQLACACGYFDQSHLIHDFLTFSGLSPTVHLRHQMEFRSAGIHTKRHHLPVAE